MVHIPSTRPASKFQIGYIVLCDSEILAWASAQIHCQFHASESRVSLPSRDNKQDVQADSDTVLIPSRGELVTRQKASYGFLCLLKSYLTSFRLHQESEASVFWTHHPKSCSVTCVWIQERAKPVCQRAIENGNTLTNVLNVVLFFCIADLYSEVVPVDGPPSFRGQAVKYVYKLTIGCQRVNSPIKLLRVPFRVLVLQGETLFSPPHV